MPTWQSLLQKLQQRSQLETLTSRQRLFLCQWMSGAGWLQMKLKVPGQLGLAFSSCQSAGGLAVVYSPWGIWHGHVNVPQTFSVP